MRHNAVIFLLISLFIVSFPMQGEEKNRTVSKKTEDKASVSKKQEKKSSNKTPAKKSAADVSKDSAPGGQYTEKDFRPKAEEESYAWLVFKTIFVIGGLVAAFYFFFQFVTKKAGIQVMGQDVIQVLSIVPVGQNKYLQVVDLAGKLLVLGVSDNSINLITEITSKEEIDRIRMLSSKSRSSSENNFQDYLTGQLGKITEAIKKKTGITAEKENTYEAPGKSSLDNGNFDYLKEQRERLKRLNGHDKKK